MNLKILFIILGYYTLISLFFTFAGSTFSDTGATYNIYLNDSGLSSGEIDQGGLFGTGVSFSRYFLFATFGVGLPDDTPSFFNIMFIAWSSIFTIFSISFIISSIWDG